MERKITKLLVSTGIVMAAAVSMIPLTSYAAVIPNVAGHGIYNCNTAGNTCASSADSNTLIPMKRETLSLFHRKLEFRSILVAYYLWMPPAPKWKVLSRPIQI